VLTIPFWKRQPLAVTGGVERRDDMGGEAARFFQYLPHQLGIDLRMRRQGAQDLWRQQYFIEHEGEVAQGRHIVHRHPFCAVQFSR
jgi:hypothetical protein